MKIFGMVASGGLASERAHNYFIPSAGGPPARLRTIHHPERAFGRSSGPKRRGRPDIYIAHSIDQGNPASDNSKRDPSAVASMNMRPVISMLVALSLVLHLALGCCMHHAHGAVSHRHRALIEMGGPCHAEKEHHHHHSPDGSSEESTPEEGDSHCDDADCSVIVRGKLDLTKNLHHGGLGCPVAIAGLQGLASPPRNRPEESWKRVPALPVRAHLLHQSLLN
jgi:hypothetical protein